MELPIPKINIGCSMLSFVMPLCYYSSFEIKDLESNQIMLKYNYYILVLRKNYLNS